MLRAREVRVRLKGKVEPDVMYCLEQLAEQQQVFREQLHDCATQMDAIVTILSNLTQVAAGMQSIKDKVEGKEFKEDE